MNNVYGVIYDGIHTDVSNSEKGAKNYATRNGYNEVSIRFNGGYNVQVIAKKINGKWEKV